MHLVVDAIIDMKRVGVLLFYFKEKIDNMIDEYILDYKKKNNTVPNLIGKLRGLLNQDENGYGQMVLVDHKVF
jgi:hypothetical protein